MLRQGMGSLEPIREESASDVKTRELPITSFKQATDPQITQPERRPKSNDPKCTCVAIAMKGDDQSSSGSKCRLSQSTIDSQRSYSSILQRPFAFRRAVSLDRAVSQQERRLIELYAKEQRQAIQEEDDTSSKASVTESTSGTTTKSTETSCVGSDIVDQQGRLMYLMGLSPDIEEARSVEQLEEIVLPAKVEEQPGETEAMRQAQKYLRIHRIFEFFQFLISHLLGALPENPINFLLDLLDKCIIYRAGMGNPPLLYEKKHINALFNLMDRMRTGYIDLKQYAAGMKTLGICSYNQNPPVSSDNMVFRDTFVEEAYENLVSILNDIIKRRWICPAGHSTAAITTPPPTPLNALSKASSKTKWTDKSNKSGMSEKSKK